jgi:Ca2+-dependent lipid-binding protein
VKNNRKNPQWNQTIVLYEFWSFYIYFFYLLFRNHLRGQDILHVEVYDEDFIFDDKIGSVKINLQELYEKRTYHKNKVFFNPNFVFL